MRVADFLRGGDDLGGVAKRKSRMSKRNNLGSSPVQSDPCTPRSFLSRWFHSPTTPGGSGEGLKLGCLVPFPKSCCTEESQEEEEREEGFASVDVAEVCDDGAAPAAMEDAVGGDGGTKLEATSFNLGMGAGLIFLLAKSVSEFNKMTELRCEMEMTLKYIKEEFQKKAFGSGLAESNVHSLPISNYWGSECSNKLNCFPDENESCNFVGAYGDVASTMQSNWPVDLENKMYAKGREMEKELQAELQCLQFNWKGLDASVQRHQETMEMASESRESSNETYQINEPKEVANKRCGVCPRELERRLHELLESRQQERIAELKGTLECTQKKLHDKEIEVCWWRDTARLLSKHREQKHHMQF
ncbi:hypothetical protein HPP92_015334 [Vanilla planifolia]|uniref:Uncharacterized protein n=1 Tax=Vanilla planifolia TaxID=51239 RepID=A0A835QPX9_VANPL|nr:hypothetical protein HPP92_015334 [Vanilla planifolia]